MNFSAFTTQLRTATSLLASVDLRGDCKATARWAFINRAALPATLNGLAAFPISYRQAIFRQMTHEQKVAAWGEHLASFLATDRGLNSAQASLIQDALINLDQMMELSEAGELFRTELESRAHETMGRPLGRLVFATLGPPDLRGPAVIGSNGIKCSCSIHSDWCGSSHDCFGVSCDQTSWGCGLGWAYACNGLCLGEEI